MSDLDIVATANNNAEISLIDVFGNVLLTEQVNNAGRQIEVRLSVAHLAAGIYFVKVVDGQNIQQGKGMLTK